MLETSVFLQVVQEDVCPSACFDPASVTRISVTGLKGESEMLQQEPTRGAANITTKSRC